jgi:hypothetical protein
MGMEASIAIQAFFDSSGKHQDRYVTLGAFAATDEVWTEFGEGWHSILRTGFLPVPYMHMVEALGLRYSSPFSRNLGWDKEKVWGLINQLVAYMSRLDKTAFRMFSCEVAMVALRYSSIPRSRQSGSNRSFGS